MAKLSDLLEGTRPWVVSAGCTFMSGAAPSARSGGISVADTMSSGILAGTCRKMASTGCTFISGAGASGVRAASASETSSSSMGVLKQSRKCLDEHRDQ